MDDGEMGPACSQNGQQNKWRGTPQANRYFYVLGPVPGSKLKLSAKRPRLDTLTMPGEQRGDNAVEPQSKRQKVGDRPDWGLSILVWAIHTIFRRSRSTSICMWNEASTMRWVFRLH